MKKFIITQLAKMGIVVAVKTAAAKKQATPASKPTEAQPTTPRTASGLLRAVDRACKGELLSVTDAPVVPEVQPVKPPKPTKAMRRAPPPSRTMADAFEKKAPVSFFERKFISITEAIAFNPTWSNGTDYYDGLPYDAEVVQSVLPGELAKCCDDHGRRMIIIGTQLGPVVVFQRYSEGTDTIVFNARPVMTSAGLIRAGSMRLSDADVEAILGGIDNNTAINISTRVDVIVNAVVPDTHVPLEQE